MSTYPYDPAYVTEDQDLSESDCPSDTNIMQHVTSDFRELYTRKHQLINQPRSSPGTYYHTHMPGYYDSQSRPLPPCACALPPESRCCYYKSMPASQEGIFRNSTRLNQNLKTCPDTKTVVKKYPVTTKTPRYYRQLCKRPSALCLPGTCQPDPAAFRKPKKTEIQHYHGQETSYDYPLKTTIKKANPVDSQGDVNSRLNDLENLLTKFQDDDEKDNEQIEIAGVSDISKILKPKVPASVKAKQDKVLKLQAVKTNLTETISVSGEKVNKLEVKEAPEEPFEVLLQRLNTDGEKLNEDRFDDNNDHKEEPRTRAEVNSKIKASHLHGEQKVSLDDTTALELHKSKSYIVSLIDRALSKELGTVPGDQCSMNEFLNMNPKKAIDLVNRHSALNDNEKVLNIDMVQGTASTKDSQCVCKAEEPLYLKQLKQLRWSHLRHIQREAKRLADLERFLDSFTETEPS